MLVLISKDWVGAKADGSRRVDEQDDMVHAEVRMGLELARQGHLTVFPILLDDATMPTAQQLPPDIADLAVQHANHLHSDAQFFVGYMNRLLDAISEQGISRQKSGPILTVPERMQYHPLIGLVLSQPQSPPPRSLLIHNHQQ